jgi:hypothetical protein
MKVMGQVGLEVASKQRLPTGESLNVIMSNDYWSDPSKTAIRVLNSIIVQPNPCTYVLDTDYFNVSSAVLDYLIAPSAIDVSKFPIYVGYTANRFQNNEYLVQVRYQVNDSWPEALEDFEIYLYMQNPGTSIKESNARAETDGKNIQWKSEKLLPGQIGVLDVLLEVPFYLEEFPLENIKISFRSRATNLSGTSSKLAHESEIEEGLKKFLIEMWIHPNTP